ncbi:MAG: hypothetical protein HY584_00255 [Candidatus Omnitrophica bacterium]|nr:hypothetical protein [Candidatus Omnitrophota bacterium]
MSYDDPMEGDIRKLLALLKKILKNHPQGSDQIAKLLDHKAVDLNLCFFTFVPMTPEDMMEFEDFYEELLDRSHDLSKRSRPKIEFKLSSEDLDFLRKHGIRF